MDHPLLTALLLQAKHHHPLHTRGAMRPPEKLTLEPEVTELICGEAGIGTQEAWLWSL